MQYRTGNVISHMGIVAGNEIVTNCQVRLPLYILSMIAFQFNSEE